MGKILVIAEKPSVGTDIAKALACRQKGDGFYCSETHIVSWAIGHLAELFEPEDYDASLKQWKIESLPIIPEKIRLKPAARTKKQFDLLKKLMNGKDTDSLICATDSGREGELIFRYIYSLAKCVKPFKRLWISSMTDAAIKQGFEDMKDGGEYDSLYESARCRSEADWLVGINATRAYTLRYKTLLSVGRVQTPTLAVITGRQKEIDAFRPEDYFEVKAEFLKTSGGTPYSGIWFDETSDETKIKTAERAGEIAGKIRGAAGRVKSVTHEKKSQPPPLLYDLTELQRDCNREFGFPAQKTLTVAQDLYEKKKMITYPRTDSRYLSNDMAPKLPAVLRGLSGAYGVFTEYVLKKDKLPLTKRIIDDSKVTDHHAIIPTEVKTGINGLSPDENRLIEDVMELAPRLKTVILLHYYQGMKVDEIAEILGIARSSVYSRLERAQQKLRVKLERGYKDE